MTKEELDKHIKEYVNDVKERQGVVTGWVLFTTCSRYDDEGDFIYSFDYSLGPDCDIARAIGIVEVGYEDLRRDIRPRNDVRE